MPSEPSHPLRRDPSQRRAVGPKFAGLALAVCATALLAFWPGDVALQQDWLPADRPCDVPVQNGRAVTDIYLTPHTSVKLLVSNLDHSDHPSPMTIRAEQLGRTPLFRGVPLAARDVSPREPDAAAVSARLPKSTAKTRVAPSLPSPDLRDFWLHVTAEPLEDARGYQQVHGQLLTSRPAVQIYGDTCLRGAAGFPKHLQDLAAAVAGELETTVLSEVSSRIGPVDDVDRDGRLTVLMTPWLSRLRGGQTQVRGFVRNCDFRNDISIPFSNRADLLYLNSDLPAGTALKTLLLHEVTHAALFSQPHTRSSTTSRVEWDDWLNEGVAHLSERSGGGDWSNLDYRVARFWQQPERAPLVVADYYRSGRWRDHGCRGATFLFLDWCAKRYSDLNHREFVAAVVATGQPGTSAVSQVMSCEFSELYRAWTVSQVLMQDAGSTRSRIGRFASSGPRLTQWDVNSNPVQRSEICGTASQFLELRSDRAGWFRLSFEGAALQAWQLTLVQCAEKSPAIDIQATWIDDVNSQPTDLKLSTSHPVPADWQLDLVACEQICDPHPMTKEWPADALVRVLRPDHPDWLIPGSAFISSPEDSAPNPAVLKVRWKHSSGRTTWAWCDLPRRSKPARNVASAPAGQKTLR